MLCKKNIFSKCTFFRIRIVILVFRCRMRRQWRGTRLATQLPTQTRSSWLSLLNSKRRYSRLNYLIIYLWISVLLLLWFFVIVRICFFFKLSRYKLCRSLNCKLHVSPPARSSSLLINSYTTTKFVSTLKISGFIKMEQTFYLENFQMHRTCP